MLQNIEDTKKTLLVDEFLEVVGPLGRFQKTVIFICSFLFQVPAYQSLITVFTAYSPPWQCSSNKLEECNDTRTYYEGDQGYNRRCNMKKESWNYAIAHRSHSIVSEFDLICSREWLSYLAQSSFFIGTVFGSLFMGWFADRYGRKKELFGSYFFLCLTSFVLSFSPNIYVLIALRGISGIFYCGIVQCTIIVCVELVGPKYRTMAGIIIWEFWGFSAILLSLQSYFVPNWRTLSQIVSLPYIIATAGIFFVPDSIRWYRSQHKEKEAEKILKKIAKMNNREYPSNISLEPIDKSCVDDNGAFRDLFSSWRTSSRTLFLSFMWFAGDCIYYGIALAFTGFGGSLHRDFALLSISGLITNLFNIYIIEKIGRRKSTFLGYAISVVGLFIFGILSVAKIKVNGLNVAIGIIVRLFSLMSWCSVEIWSTEIYPTNVRSKAVGLFFFSSQIGSSTSPWIARGLTQFHSALPFFILGALPLISLFFSFTLPETKGTIMDDVAQKNSEPGGKGNTTNLIGNSAL